MASLDMIKRVTKKIAPGRIPSFNEVHVIKALETIGTQDGVGRKKLSTELELGEGATRTLIKHLKTEQLVVVSRLGITLTESGEALFSALRSHLSEGVEIPRSPLTMGPHNIAVLVKNVGQAVKYGLEQRDAAIRVGASGATTLIFHQDRMSMPGVAGDIFKDASAVRRILLTRLHPQENDVIIIGSAQTKREAEFGAKMSAFELLTRQQ